MDTAACPTQYELYLLTQHYCYAHQFIVIIGSDVVDDLGEPNLAHGAPVARDESSLHHTLEAIGMCTSHSQGRQQLSRVGPGDNTMATQQ